ncbi:DUF2298 domain-containing protein [Sinimarinibacterium thermocellulolyticum]|uniref:DUF2298 domain-containing protein n=1 Tax=Sinimarinibacterium thermocellulolyticum TaxID=3170016 RepID=A0ABV2A9J1_9GAMM
MTAWFSLLFVFIVPTADLGLRLLGLPSAAVFAGDLVLLAFGIAWPHRSGWRWPGLRALTPAVLNCVALAAAIYVLRACAFRFSPFGENIYDLHYIVSLVQAQQWPAAELWNPGSVITHYYYLGFYIVAFYTRLLGLHPGIGYALFLILIPVLVFANYWAVLRGAFVFRALAAFTATFPATGLSALVASGALPIAEHLRGMAHVRLPEWADLATGGWLAQVASGDAYPIESLAHLIGWLGDLHPPVFTFLLLAIVIGALFGEVGAEPHVRGAVRVQLDAAPIAAAAVPLSFALNPWTLPCFALLGAYAMLRRREAGDVQAGLLGAGGALVLLLPLLLSLDLPTGSVSLAWLPAERRSTIPLFGLVWGPLLCVSLLLALLRLRLTMVLPFIAMVVGLEILLMDDPYAERYERFNGVLKIGSLALAGWTAAVLLLAARDARRWLQVLVLTPLLALSVLQLVDALAPSARVPMRERNWALQPQRMLQREDHRELYAALSSQCPGATLERRQHNAYTDSPLVSTLLGWPTYSGWSAHLSQIGAMDEAERRRSDAMQQWFERPDAASLRALSIRYVLVDRSLGWDARTVQAHARALAPAFRFEQVSAAAVTPVIGYFVASAPCVPDATAGAAPTTRSMR